MSDKVEDKVLNKKPSTIAGGGLRSSLLFLRSYEKTELIWLPPVGWCVPVVFFPPVVFLGPPVIWLLPPLTSFRALRSFTTILC